MIEREYEDLIQEVLEGDATPQQIERLETWLAGSEAGRARRRELEGVFRALCGVSEVDPPPDLKNDILRALRARPAPGRAKGLARSWVPGSRFRPAFIFAAGLAAGAVGYGAVTRLPAWPPGDSSVMGTMMPTRTPPSAAEGIRRGWSVGPSRVEAISWLTPDSRLAVFQVREGEARIEIEYDPARLSVVGVAQTHAEASLIAAGPGRLVVSGGSRSEFTVEWRQLAADSPAPRVTVQSGGATARGDLPPAAAFPAGR